MHSTGHHLRRQHCRLLSPITRTLTTSRPRWELWPTASRNTLPLKPINDLDATAIKRFNITERYAFEFQAQAFNTLNHPQFISGSINTVDSKGDTSGGTTNFLRPTNGLFDQASKVFSSNSRTLQLAAKFVF